MATSIANPALTWKDGARRPAIEVSLDFIPERFEGRWLSVVRKFTLRWVKNNKFKKNATIWMWGCISVNLISRHPENPIPSWSEFLVQFGFPARFADELAVELTQTFENQAAMTEHLSFNYEDGWTAVCHVEQGRVWVAEDPTSWIEFQ